MVTGGEIRYDVMISPFFVLPFRRPRYCDRKPYNRRYRDAFPSLNCLVRSMLVGKAGKAGKAGLGCGGLGD